VPDAASGCFPVPPGMDLQQAAAFPVAYGERGRIHAAPLCPLCTLCVPFVYPLCTLCVPFVYPLCTLCVPFVYPLCTLTVYSVPCVPYLYPVP
jgi:hypothetical protein